MPPSVQRPSLKQALREVLTNAFQGLELNMLVDDVFGRKLGDLVVTEKSAPEVRFSLINWAEARDKLGDLIDGAMYRKPSNFNKFILDYLEEIFTILELELDKFSGKDLNNLVEIIQNSKAVKLASEACIKTLPDGVSQDYPEEIKCLNTDQTPDAYRLYIVFKLLLSYPKDGENLRILNFIETLSKENQIRSNLKEKLRKLLPDKLFPPVNDLPSNFLERPSRNPKLANGYLLFEIRKMPDFKKEKFHINAFLEYDELGKPVHLPVDLADSPEEKSQRGTSCSYQSLAETVVKLIHLGEERFSAKRGDTAGPLILEFFLPYEYLTEKIDLWEIEPLKDVSKPIGSQYDIILRSSDRMENHNLLSKLKQSWERLESLRKRERIPKKQWLECFLHIEGIDFYWEQDISKKIGVKLTCGLPEDGTKKATLISEVLLTNLPVAIWSRSGSISEIPNLSEALNQFLKIEHFRDISMLLKCVQMERAKAARMRSPEKYLGHHIAFLYDDPYRPLPQFQPLSIE